MAKGAPTKEWWIRFLPVAPERQPTTTCALCFQQRVLHEVRACNQGCRPDKVNKTRKFPSQDKKATCRRGPSRPESLAQPYRSRDAKRRGSHAWPDPPRASSCPVRCPSPGPGRRRHPRTCVRAVESRHQHRSGMPDRSRRKLHSRRGHGSHELRVNGTRILLSLAGAHRRVAEPITARSGASATEEKSPGPSRALGDATGTRPWACSTSWCRPMRCAHDTRGHQWLVCGWSPADRLSVDVRSDTGGGRPVRDVVAPRIAACCYQAVIPDRLVAVNTASPRLRSTCRPRCFRRQAHQLCRIAKASDANAIAIA